MDSAIHSVQPFDASQAKVAGWNAEMAASKTASRDGQEGPVHKVKRCTRVLCILPLFWPLSFPLGFYFILLQACY